MACPSLLRAECRGWEWESRTRGVRTHHKFTLLHRKLSRCPCPTSGSGTRSLKLEGNHISSRCITTAHGASKHDAHHASRVAGKVVLKPTRPIRPAVCKPRCRSLHTEGTRASRYTGSTSSSRIFVFIDLCMNTRHSCAHRKKET